jgi:hypothetical protein
MVLDKIGGGGGLSLPKRFVVHINNVDCGKDASRSPGCKKESLAKRKKQIQLSKSCVNIQ